MSPPHRHAYEPGFRKTSLPEITYSDQGKRPEYDDLDSNQRFHNTIHRLESMQVPTIELGSWYEQLGILENEVHSNPLASVTLTNYLTLLETTYEVIGEVERYSKLVKVFGLKKRLLVSNMEDILSRATIVDSTFSKDYSDD